MNSTPLAPAGSLPMAAACQPAEGSPALRPFRRLLDELWPEMGEKLSRMALGLGLTGDQAADALQDVYLMALQKPPAIDDGAELVRWLVRVTVNRCHLEHRRRSRWRKLWDSLATAWQADAAPPPGAAGRGELKRDVEVALAKLTDEDRTLVAMRYFADLNSREIGEIMNVPESTIRGRLRAARRKLAEELADWNDHQ
jgi:RNA polymerase sigma factor (sigma-70 family)